MRLTYPLNLPAPGRSQTLYVGFSPSQSPVFLVNSRYPLFSAAHRSGHTFFRSYGVNLPSSLEESSLGPLRLFASPTCVGLRYGRPLGSLRGFSWKRSIVDSALTRLHSAFGDDCPAFIRTRHSYDLRLALPPASSTNFLRRPSVQRLTAGAGILTCLPSPTPFGLGLGSG